jgi:hypothetical protein
MSSSSYLGLKPAPIWIVLVKSSTSIQMALAFSATLKASDMEGMAGLAKEGSALRHNSFNSVAVTTIVASSMLFCS